MTIETLECLVDSVIKSVSKMSGKNCILLLLFAVLVSLIFGGVHIFLSLKIGDSYSPILLNSSISSFTGDETIAYAPKVREVFDGNLVLTDMYLKEHKTLPSPLIGENLPALIMGFLAKISGGVPSAFIWSDFLFPPIILIILTLLVFSFSRNFPFSIFVSLVVIFHSGILELVPYVPSIIQILIKQPIKGSYSSFLRSFHPQVSFPLFGLFLLLALFAFKKNKIYLWLASGILLGLLFYTDIFFSTYAFLITALFLLRSLIKKDFLSAKKILIILFTGALIGLPYAVNFFLFNQLPQSKSFIENFQYPIILPWKTIIFCLTAIFFTFFLKPKKTAVFFRIVFLAGLLLMLSSYLLKINVNDMPGHWAMRVIYPFAVILFFLIIQQIPLLKKSSAIWLFLSILIIVMQFSSHYHYFSKKNKVFAMPREEKEMFFWLNDITPKDCTVATASLRLNLLIPALTHNNVFLPYSQYSLAGEKESLERFFILYKFLNISPERVETMFQNNPEKEKLAKSKRLSRDDCAASYFYYLKFKTKNDYSCFVPVNKLNEITNSYENFKIDEKKPFEKYQADYLLIGPYAQKWARISVTDQPYLKLIKQNKSYQLYQIVN